ncbi:MAG: hypothetical protein JXQ75_18675 [Phycisphaerae bacterium]|nr:hypothetical protein [Phycisphaerae bacterium]
MMSRELKFLPCLLVVLLAVSQVSAQTPRGAGQASAEPAKPPRPDDEAQMLMEVHLKIVQELYHLNADQIAKLRPAMVKLVPSQERYDAQTAVTLRRLRIARSIVTNDQTLAEGQRAERAEDFERQYRRITARAPLSIASIASQAEALLSKEEIAAAHAQIKAKLASRLKGDDQITPETIDALLSGPIPLIDVPRVQSTPSGPIARPERNERRTESVPPSNPPPPSRDPAKTRPKRPNPAAVEAAKRPTIEAPLVKRSTPDKPASSEPLRPAPPESEWDAYIKATSTKFGFTDAQMQAAKNALNGCQSRALAHRQQRQGDYKAAEKLANPGERTETLSKLHNRLDVLYHELTQRVDAIVTVEQRQRVEGITVPERKQPRATPLARDVQPQPPQPPPPPRPLDPAPPESQWAGFVETTSTKMSFSEGQMAVAKGILDSCLSRASAHREQTKTAYATAEQIADQTKKVEEVRKLNRRLDELYDELTQRVSAITTVEQQERVNGVEPPKRVAPRATPMSTGAAKTAPSEAQPPEQKKPQGQDAKTEPSE